MMEENRTYRYEARYHGKDSTRWAEDEEIRDVLTRVDLYAEGPAACGLPIVSDGRTAYVDATDSHSLILGSTGSKKSRLLVMPMMHMIARAGESVVCTDPKGELFQRTSGVFAAQGYKILVLNLRDPSHSHGWSPLHLAASLMEAGDPERAYSIINDLAATLFPMHVKTDPFWTESSRSLFCGLAGMVVEQPDIYGNYSLRTISQLLTGLGDADGSGATSDLMSEYPSDSLSVPSLETALAGSERTWSNVKVSYLAALQHIYSRNTLIDMLSTPEIDFADVGMQKTALYIIMNDEKTTLHGVVSLLVKQCYEALIDRAQQCEGLTLPVRVNFMLDEFSNLPAIPDMSSMISAARSRNIRFYLVVQSLHQLASKYGDDAETIRGNCTNWAYLTSRELAMLREISDLCGADSRTHEPLISISQLQRLDKQSGEVLMLCGRLYPYISYLADIDEYPFAEVPAAALPDLKPLSHKALDIRKAIKLLKNKMKDQQTRTEIVTFGRWDGQPMRWYRVWKREEQGVELLLAEEPVVSATYDTGNQTSCSWQLTTLCRWLNMEFLKKAFTLEERAQIVETSEVYLQVPYPVGAVFLPSREEIEQYVQNDPDLIDPEDTTFWLRVMETTGTRVPQADVYVPKGRDFTMSFMSDMFPSDNGTRIQQSRANRPYAVRPALIRRTDALEYEQLLSMKFEELFGNGASE